MLSVEANDQRMREAANRGEPEAQCFVGSLYSLGRRVAVDKAEAARWWSMSASQGCAEAQVKLAELYNSGDGVRRDVQIAVQLYRNAATQGHVIAQHDLACLLMAPGPMRNISEAIKWFRSAAERNLPRAQYVIGYFHLTGDPLPQDSAEAAKWLRKAAERNYCRAQYHLGLLLARGDGVDLDLSEAASWQSRAAEQAYPPSMCVLGSLFLFGAGVPQDRVKAEKWLGLASECGDANAVLLMKKHDMPVPPFAMGMSPAPQSEAPLIILEKLAAEGVGRAMCALGEIYHEGKGVPIDRAKARKYFEGAARRQIPEAQCMYGHILFEDAGNSKSPEALHWFFEAGQRGHRGACLMLLGYVSDSITDQTAVEELLRLSLVPPEMGGDLFVQKVLRLALIHIPGISGLNVTATPRTGSEGGHHLTFDLSRLTKPLEPPPPS